MAEFEHAVVEAAVNPARRDRGRPGVRGNTMTSLPTTRTTGKIIKGTNGDDLIRGSKFPDKIYGKAGNDRLYGEEGNDLISGGPGMNYLDGGYGNNTVSYADVTAPVTVDLITQKGSWSSVNEDYLIGFRNIIGSRYNDKLYGLGDYPNTLTGGRGDDELYGRGGNDTLVPGPGADVADGGDGVDTVSYAPAGAAVTVDLGNAANNRGDAKGDSYVSIENAGGTRFGDTLTGNAGVNRLNGYAGNDTLDGAGGGDILVGGPGADTLTGGTGRDYFRHSALGEGPDVVKDFSLTQMDWVSFRAAGFGGTLTPGPLPATSFVKGANPLPTTTATTFLYDTDTGQLFVDLDGIGTKAGRTELMTLVGIPAIDAGDFNIF